MDRTEHDQATVSTNGASRGDVNLSARRDAAVSHPPASRSAGAAETHRTRAKVCELVSQLQWGPKTAAELIEATGLAHGTTYLWLDALRNAGAIYVHELRNRHTKQARVWALQPRPFERGDAA